MSTSMNNESGRDEAQNLRLKRAQDPRTSPYELKSLSKDPDWLVRSHVAANPGTPEGSLWELSYDDDSRVREAAFNRLDALGFRVAGLKAPVWVQSKAVEQSDSENLGQNSDSLSASFLKEDVSFAELLKDAAAIEYKGIIFDDWLVSEDNSVWAEMCSCCAEKYKDVISAELDDASAIGICSVLGCEVSGLENEEAPHYYVDFKPELIHPLSKEQLQQLEANLPGKKVSLDEKIAAASMKASNDVRKDTIPRNPER